MLKEKASSYYRQGYNCAEALMLAMNDHYGLGLPAESIHLVSGFGGGMGSEKACGALTGALAALSAMLKEERRQDKAAFGQACGEWVAAFIRDLGSDDCARLKDLYRKDDVGCLPTVERAADSFQQYWQRRQQG